MIEGEPKLFDCPPIFHGVAGQEKRGVLADETGDKIDSGVDGVGSEATVSDLESVVDQTRLTGRTVAAEGEKNSSDIKNEPIGEVEGGRDLVEKYLEILFQKFSGRIYRPGSINESAIGNKVNLHQGPRDYIYVIPNSEFEGMEKFFDNSVPALSIDTVGVNFSQMTGLDSDYLKNEKLGFSRRLVVDGKEYNIKFLRLYDGKETEDNNLDDNGQDEELPLAA